MTAGKEEREGWRLGGGGGGGQKRKNRWNGVGCLVEV